jgi:2,3-bisphosphoglycerate-dependent phosphoglycerate mutase
MQILLIRHGQSEADILNVHEGRADFSLTELGRTQAARMADTVAAQFPPERIFASILKRATETATILVEKICCPIEFRDSLMERHNGKQAGLPIEEGNRLYPVPKLPHERIPDGETWFEFRARAETALSEILTECADAEHIAIVSHGGMITALMQSFLNLPMQTSNWFATGDTGIHLLQINHLGPSVRFLNNTAHLGDLEGERY